MSKPAVAGGTILRDAERKLKGRTPLAAPEVAMLQAITGAAGDPAAPKWARSKVELGEILGVTRMTIHRGSKRAGCPGVKSDGRYDVAAWRAFLGGKAADNGNVDVLAEKARNILLQNQKLEAQIAILRRQYVATVDVKQWGAEAGAAVRKIVCQLHRSAAQLAGLPTADIEDRLKTIEDEILGQLNALGDRIERGTEHAEPAD